MNLFSKNRLKKNCLKFRNVKTIALALFILPVQCKNNRVQPVNFRDWAPTPPMGWNSWDCYGPNVTEAEVKANADYMAENLKEYGWKYIIVDIRWYVSNDKAGGYNQTNPDYNIDKFGRYIPAVNKFPSSANGRGFKPLADYIHSKGLKFGIHTMRGIPRKAVAHKLPIKGTRGINAGNIYSEEGLCWWLNDNCTVMADSSGAQEYYNSVFELYASWKVDFVKVDDLLHPYHRDEIEMIRKAIDRCGRSVVLSTSPGETPLQEAAHVSMHANMWRLVADVWDEWDDVRHLMDVTPGWSRYIGNGTWPDCDMIPLGKLSIQGERGEERFSKLTRDEQYSLMTLLCIFRSPLMFGGDLPQNKALTDSLLTNKEVLRMHRESVENRNILLTPEKSVWAARHPETGETYVAMFNISDNPAPLEVKLSLDPFGIKGACKVVDLWQNRITTIDSGELTENLKPHSCRLFKIAGMDKNQGQF